MYPAIRSCDEQAFDNMSEGGEWWEKDEGGVFERGEWEAWREKSVMVALRVRGERGELVLQLEKKNG